jgi:hypothetical protein
MKSFAMSRGWTTRGHHHPHFLHSSTQSTASTTTLRLITAGFSVRIGALGDLLDDVSHQGLKIIVPCKRILGDLASIKTIDRRSTGPASQGLPVPHLPIEGSQIHIKSRASDDVQSFADLRET